MRCFVDTNIIISYINRESARLCDVIDNGAHRFYYTETVRAELKRAAAPPVFIYTDSGLCATKKERVLRAVASATHWTDEQVARFRNDLYINIECGFAAPDYMDFTDTGIVVPPLLTNNMKFLRKVIDKYSAQIEECINLYGCEHLCQFKTPAEL